MNGDAIVARALAKRYGRIDALRDLTLRVARGECLGFLGPNGAGKSTAVKMLVGLVRPSGGDALVLDRPLGDRATRTGIGYLPELFRYPDWLSASEVLAFHARLLRLRDAPRAIDEVLDEVGLRDRRRDRVGTFSKGMQQRLGLAVALLGAPRVVFLDEPTSALDPVGRSDVRALIERLRARGTTVFLNSHLLGEVERVCDRVCIVDRGSVVAEGSIDALTGERRGVRVRLETGWRRIRCRRRRDPRPRRAPGRRRRTHPRGGADARDARRPVPEPGARRVNVLLFASLTVRELVRRRLLVIAAVGTLLIVAFTGWGMHRLATATMSGSPLALVAVRATAAGIVLVLAFLFSFVVALGGAMIGAPAMAETIANGELLAVLARPVRRADVVIGRWLGTVIALAAYVALAGGAELLVVRITTGYAPPHPFAALLFLSASGAVVASTAIALATRLPALAAGAAAALLFGLAWVAGIVESIGLSIGNARVADAGTLVALVFPSDALWRGAVYALEPAVFTVAVGASNGNGPANPFTVTSPPPTALLVWAFAWIVVVVACGAAAFRTRDL